MLLFTATLQGILLYTILLSFEMKMREFVHKNFVEQVVISHNCPNGKSVVTVVNHLLQLSKEINEILLYQGFLRPIL